MNIALLLGMPMRAARSQLEHALALEPPSRMLEEREAPQRRKPPTAPPPPKSTSQPEPHDAADRGPSTAPAESAASAVGAATPTDEHADDGDSPADTVFQFEGYIRSGFGVTARGSQQVDFRAPGAGARYRLGNEPETYGLFTLSHNWLNAERQPKQAWFRTEVMLQVNTQNAWNFDQNDRYQLREGFVQGGNIWRSQPQARIWAGERDYQRKDIHILDYFPVDMSGHGGGIEGLRVGPGQLAVAVFGAANSEVSTERGTYVRLSLDVRYYDVPAPFGVVSLWGLASAIRGGSLPDASRLEDSVGWAFGVRHLWRGQEGNYNDLLVAYGTGAGSTFQNVPPDPARAAGAARWLVAEHLLLQPNRWFAIMPALVYQRESVAGARPNQWLSIGARPVFFLSEHASLAVESGFDWVRDGERGSSGWLHKLTLAPQLGLAPRFSSRPVARLFATFASWSSEFRGRVGGQPFAERLSGITCGVQGESWW